MATFLIGAWIAGCIFMACISMLSLRAPEITMGLPHTAVAKMTQQIGDENMTMLLRHSAAEQCRFFLKRWEAAQVLIGLALAGALFLGTQRRILPMLLCGIMVAMVVFQYRITTELGYLGKETDFPPGSLTVGTTTRYLMLDQVYIGAEVMKYIAAAILTGFLFIFRAGRRRGKEVHAIDHADHSHVDG